MVFKDYQSLMDITQNSIISLSLDKYTYYQEIPMDRVKKILLKYKFLFILVSIAIFVLFWTKVPNNVLQDSLEDINAIETSK